MDKFNELIIATTDTVVGLGGPMTKDNENAIYELKKRPRNKPLIVMVSSFEQAREFQEWNEKAEEYANKYWPGATTLVLTEKLAIRMPDSEGLLSLLEKIGPIYMTSANLSGQRTLSFKEAVEQFPEVKHTYDFGKGSGKASRIIDINTGKELR